MNRYLRRIIISVIIAPLLGILYILGVMYFYDPLQFFSEKYPLYYHGDTRLSAKRVIDNYNFDSVMLGTSMLLMSDPKELKNGKYINITLDGSIIKERDSILQYLFFKKNNIKNIVYTFDGIADVTDYYKKDFSKIYNINDSFVDKINIYFFGLIPYECFFIYSKKEKCIGKKHNYYDLQLEFSRPDYKLIEDDFNLIRNSFQLENQIDILEKYFIKYVKNNPDTIFHVIIPPYHTLYYKKNIDNLIGIYRIGIKKLSQYKNVKIYFFGNERFSDNINNWQNDKQHYKKHINSRINKAINEGTNIISIDNMEEEFNKFIKKVESYDIKAYKEALKLDIRE